MVDDDGVAGGALALDPADALAELGLGITSEELAAVSLPKQKIWGVEREKKKKLTIKSSAILLALPQADMTQASL